MAAPSGDRAAPAGFALRDNQSARALSADGSFGMKPWSGIPKVSAAAGLCLAGLLGFLTPPTIMERVVRGQMPSDAEHQRAACETQAASSVPPARLSLLARGLNLTSW